MLLLLGFSALIGLISPTGALDVTLPNGIVRGYELQTVNGKTYYSFAKIPYAAPPVGELRFKPPISAKNWDEPLDTVRLDVTCYETGANTDLETEDCLYLSVFSPNISRATLPVLFYIHGGGFVGGSADWIYSDHIIDDDVILVAINYRLGPFGFLSTQDEVIPGNNGLKDQLFALRWVQDNIQYFGGDSKKVTIMGNSAGSASCAYHLLNQQSRGLFRGAILESGTYLSPWAFQRRSKEIAFATAALINDTFATSNDTQALFEFLQSVDSDVLDTAAEQYHDIEASPADTEILQGFYWAPVLEVKNPDAFLTKKMYQLAQAGNTVGVPILIGQTSEEGLAFNTNPDSVKETMGAYDEHLDWLVPFDMRIEDEDARTEMGEKIRAIYTGGEPLADNLGDGIRYFSDTAFTRSVIKTAEFYSKYANTFFYQFSHDGKVGPSYPQYDGAEKVGHSVDYSYIWCWPPDCDLSRYSESDALAIQRFNRILTNFVKYLHPTPRSNEPLLNITWPSVNTDNGDFFYVDINENLEIKNHPKEETYSKWVDLYNTLNYTDFDTY